MIDYEDLCKWRTIIDGKLANGSFEKAHLMIRYCYECDGFDKTCAAYITDISLRKLSRTRDKKKMAKAHDLEVEVKK